MPAAARPRTAARTPHQGPLDWRLLVEWLSEDGVIAPEHIERSLRQSNLAAARPIADQLRDREHQVVLQAVHRNPGRLDQAAKELGVSRTTLWRRMRKYGIRLAGAES